ncbi:MAG: Zn-dependent hydrolase [Gaiellaceae bacterium]|jgi:allantoate deiminase
MSVHHERQPAARQLEQRIAELAKIGQQPEGGVYRGAYAPPQLEAEHLIATWMASAGLIPRRDAAGNIWGTTARQGDTPSIVLGSHVDSVSNGGNYDGVYGVLAAISAVGDVVAEHGVPPVPIEVVAFTGEEGSRFPIGLLGSRVVAGEIGRGDLEGLRDYDGIAIADAFRTAGLDLANVESARRHDIGAYLELHIEQGPILEAAQANVGLVEVIVGIQQYMVRIEGRAQHGGTTPMSMRKDALVVAAAMVPALRDLAATVDEAVLTVGSFVVRPGMPNVIPGRVEFTIDMRHHDSRELERLAVGAFRFCRSAAEDAGVCFEWNPMGPPSPPAAMSRDIVELLAEISDQLGLTSIRLPSRAGHDAKPMAGICPTGMLFVPSIGGLSHTPAEHTTTADMLNGIRVLLHAVYALAYRDRLGLLNTAVPTERTGEGR